MKKVKCNLEVRQSKYVKEVIDPESLTKPNLLGRKFANRVHRLRVQVEKKGGVTECLRL